MCIRARHLCLSRAWSIHFTPCHPISQSSLCSCRSIKPGSCLSPGGFSTEISLPILTTCAAHLILPELITLLMSTMFPNHKAPRLGVLQLSCCAKISLFFVLFNNTDFRISTFKFYPRTEYLVSVKVRVPVNLLKLSGNIWYYVIKIIILCIAVNSWLYEMAIVSKLRS